MTTPPAAPAPTPVDLNDDMKAIIDGAVANGTPVVFAYVDTEGQPSLSIRGSTQVYSPKQLAVWVRNPSGGFLKALPNNPRVSLMYRDPAARNNIIAKGRGRIDSSEDVRNKVYETAPQSEKNADPDKKGLALIIDVDNVAGVVNGNRLMMRA